MQIVGSPGSLGFTPPPRALPAGRWQDKVGDFNFPPTKSAPCLRSSDEGPRSPPDDSTVQCSMLRRRLSDRSGGPPHDATAAVDLDARSSCDGNVPSSCRIAASVHGAMPRQQAFIPAVEGSPTASRSTSHWQAMQIASSVEDTVPGHASSGMSTPLGSTPSVISSGLLGGLARELGIIAKQASPRTRASIHSALAAAVGLPMHDVA